MSKDFLPSLQELAITDTIFAQTDSNNTGHLPGQLALLVFGRTKLSPAVLSEIWNIADEENNGWLSKKGVAMALRLIGHAQTGKSVSKSLLTSRMCSSLRLPNQNQPVPASWSHCENRWF
jgi:epidermal growth factor receptor substrate 15